MNNNKSKKAQQEIIIAEAKIRSIWKSVLFLLIFSILLLAAFAPNWNIQDAFFMASVIHFCLVMFWIVFQLGFMSKSFHNWKQMIKNHPFKKASKNPSEKEVEKDEFKSWLGIIISSSIGLVLLVASALLDFF